MENSYLTLDIGHKWYHFLQEVREALWLEKQKKEK